ncbi:MAG: hypothetical protein Q7U35_06795 [Methanobacteriaceae archaeon]|nr:hypothetical protein [Methanobacteriaceae archaeon]MDP2837307.1 hypothetical protein [Methanobacteriaceae archaeon]MDP3034724.1 hypothetical protein [Methanobacteriaceae archaeon]MDP3484189.1 hypothetical protein [Methanobacteriaceae archaeon]MDP3624636.1 hypothetical protein [Methanobacteriaceae archaeon]
MSKIVLISCVSQKQEKSAQAKDLYISPLFKYNFKYANMLKPDNIFILSAKYGLLTLEQEIDPYDETLNNFSALEKKLWSDKVLEQLKEVSDLKNDEFIFLAGENYRKHLLPHLNNYEIPMKGLGIGKQLGYLKEKVEISEKCGKLHEIFNSMEKIQFPFSDEKIPKNGIYVLFENGEESHNTNRIVRIGTHTGDDQLRSRLKQHFMNENKDRSIFRKNIGRSLLNKESDPFLEYWELDLTTRKAKEKYHDLIDFNKQYEIEKRVTQYLQNNLSFVVFEVNEKEKRLELESKIISTISLCEDCRPSDDWLGNYSPKSKIRESGLWLVNELYKEPLSDENLGDLMIL